MQPSGQSGFTAALLSPDVDTPQGIVDPQGRIAPKRFAVYRNNVTVSLIEALSAAFPRVLTMVGEDFFREMARQFVRVTPPSSPLIMEYGYEYPDFIAAFEPAKTVPFLSDIAHLDRAWLDSFHEGDASLLNANKFAGIGEDELAGAVFVPQPSFRVVKSQFPLVTLWNAAKSGTPPVLANTPAPEWALVVRPEYEVDVISVSAAEGGFFFDLQSGANLGQAAENAMENDAQFDFAAALAKVVSCGAFTDVNFE